MKSLRCNLLKYDTHTPDGIILFNHIEKFYNIDKREQRQCAPKLTNKHIYATCLNSMKVSLSAQIFSNAVAAGMNVYMKTGDLSTSAKFTIEFVGQINDLFDSVNGSTKKTSL